jgi:ornithine cyclodeaminase/alanine dehydrogenase-like protein (mu-crystallin family)
MPQGRKAIAMGEGDEILYLNSSDLDRLEFTMPQMVPMLEEMFRLKAGGKTLMPPKIFFHRDGPRFYSAMVSCAPGIGYAGCKWQSGDPENPARGLPYIQGVYLLSEDATGRPIAIMDSKWITGNRTAAATAVAAKHLAPSNCQTLAILGCGLQGRKNLEALQPVLPSINRCQAFDIVPEREIAFVTEARQSFSLEAIACRSAEAAVRGADIVVTAGPIEEHRRPVIVSEWLKAGSLTVTLDYDSYITDEAISAMDLILTDDRGQIDDARKNEGKFQGVDRVDAELADLIAFGRGARTSDNQRVLVFNLGIALEDLATAVEIVERARRLSVGTKLPL